MSSVPAAEPPALPRRRRWPLVVLVIALAVLALLVALWTAAGFWLVPALVKRVLPQVAEQRLHRHARIGDVRFNPFTFHFEAQAFALEEEDGRPLAGFGAASIDLSWSSLPRRALVLDGIRLDKPFVNVVVDKGGRLNLARLVPEDNSPSEHPDNAALPRFDIARLEIAQGRVGFEDQRGGYRNSLDDLAFKLDDLSTIDKGKGDYTLSARTPGGAKLHWQGNLALAPLAAAGTLSLIGLALPELNPYLARATRAGTLASGRADLELPCKLELPGGEPRLSLTGAKLEVSGLALISPQGKPLAKTSSIALAGADFSLREQSLKAKSLAVSGLELGSTDAAQPFVRVGQLSLSGVEGALGEQSLKVQSLLIDGPQLAVARDAAGNFDLLQWLAALSGAASASPSATAAAASSADAPAANGQSASQSATRAQSNSADKSWNIGIAAVDVRNANAAYRDATARTPLAATLQGVAVHAGLQVSVGGGTAARIRLDGGSVQAQSMALAPADAAASAAPVSVTGIDVGGVVYDGSALTIDHVKLAGLKAAGKLREGRLDLTDLLPPFKPDPSSRPLALSVGSVELADGAVTVADADHGLELGVQHLKAKAGGIVPDKSKPLTFDVTAGLASGGSLAASGRFTQTSNLLDAKVQVNALALAPLQTLLSRYARVRLASGEVSLSGTVQGSLTPAQSTSQSSTDGAANTSTAGNAATTTAAAGSTQTAGPRADRSITYRGNVTIANVAIDDDQGGHLAGWQSLTTDSLRFRLSPMRLAVGELRLVQPFGRLALAKDRTSNFAHLLPDSSPTAPAAPPAKSASTASPISAGVAAPAQSATAPSPNAPDAAPASQAAEPAIALAISRLAVSQGHLDFSDASIDPNFAVDITGLNGAATGLSNSPDTRSQFALEGNVGEFGFARLSGALNLYALRDRTTFRIELRNIDMPSVTPYAMRFAGYRIASGRLNLDLNYQVRGSAITGDNRIVLSSFTLGERVQSPNALNLPLDLAIALLKDPDGSINVDLPVSGNLDDPQFSFAPLIWKALGNLLTDIVAAPFRLIGRMFGGGEHEETGSIQFEAADSRLLPPEHEKLAKLAALLQQRPQLQLVVPAHYDASVDGPALKRRALAADVLRRTGVAAGQEDEVMGPINVDDRRTRAALRGLYEERFSKAEYDQRVADAEAAEKNAKTAKPAKPEEGAAGQRVSDQGESKSLSLGDRARKLVAGEPQLAEPRPFYVDLVRRLRAAQPLPPDALTQLGTERANAIADALRAAGVNAERIATPAPEPTKASAATEPPRLSGSDARYVKLELSLNAR
jgi:hypothetical protein